MFGFQRVSLHHSSRGRGSAPSGALTPAGSSRDGGLLSVKWSARCLYFISIFARDDLPVSKSIFHVIKDVDFEFREFLYLFTIWIYLELDGFEPSTFELPARHSNH